MRTLNLNVVQGALCASWKCMKYPAHTAHLPLEGCKERAPSAC
jgi:hypothetical protein